MGHAYRAVGWNPQKRIYDRTLVAAVALYIALFLLVGFLLFPASSAETTLIRAFGTGAFFLLHIILCIGPLCRLDTRFLPLLYNRRHMGVTMFVLALAHGALATFQFHALGDVNPLVSLLASNPRFDSLANFPFQPLGLTALAILFLMAATSHDFWLTNLTAPVWKTLHSLVYVAYVLLVAHVALGALQTEMNPLFVACTGIGVVLVSGLHIVAARKELEVDHELEGAATDGFLDVCAVDELVDGRGRTVTISGDRVALFLYDGKVSALSNACQHQNGPLGEGRILNGCVVCPWHGYEYKPDCGSSPEPFTEKVPTFRTRLEAGRVLVHPTPLPAGTFVEPARIDDHSSVGGPA